MKKLLIVTVLVMAGCTAIGTLHNPACIVACQNNGQDTITTNKEVSLPLRERTTE